MKKIIAIALAFVLVAAVGITGFIFFHREKITQTITLSQNEIAKWTFEADKNVRAHAKIKIVSASLTDQTEAKLLIKGSSGNGRKQISAEDLTDKKGTSISLPFRKGEENYLIFSTVGCDSIELKVTVTTYTFKRHIRALGIESGKDYGR